MRPRPFAEACASSNARGCRRATARLDAATESSRSRISASAPLSSPRASFLSLSAGTNRKERIDCLRQSCDPCRLPDAGRRPEDLPSPPFRGEREGPAAKPRGRGGGEGVSPPGSSGGGGRGPRSGAGGGGGGQSTSALESPTSPQPSPPRGGG